jgi:hypothetical protein
MTGGMTTREDLERWSARVARGAAAGLDELDLRSRLVGIAVFAVLVQDTKVRNAAMTALEILDRLPAST